MIPNRRQEMPGSHPAALLSSLLQQIGLAAIVLRDCLGLYLGIAAGRARLDLPALAAALRQTGLSILPAITLVTLILGLILGALTSSVLLRLDLPALILVPLSYAVVMELMPLLVGILVAGRAGVALAVRLASLVDKGEMDGLLITGIDPIPFLTGPTLLAMLLMSFAFAVWGVLVTFGAAVLWLWVLDAVPPALFLESLRLALTPADLAEAWLKPLAFALGIALVATVNGALAGRHPDHASRAATRTMIGAVIVILLTDLIFVLSRNG